MSLTRYPFGTKSRRGSIPELSFTRTGTMVDSMSDAIIENPRGVIEKIFNEAGNEDLSSDYGIPKTFQDAFSERVQLEKIPRLDEIPPSSLTSGKVVRFLGMVQDTSYSQEIYVGMSKQSGTKWSFYRYRETPQVDVDINSPDIKLDERHGVYVTSIPGVARWLETSDSIESLSLEEMGLLGEKERIVSYGQQKEIGAVVKCYCGAENKLKVCDLVEVIGILEIPESEEEAEIVLHAVTIYPRHLNDVVIREYGKLESDAISKAREIFINHITNLLEGDNLAAQSILLNLTSNLTHRNPTPLGPIPMNIYSLSQDLISPVVSFLKSILPAVAFESISIDSLNSHRLYAKSDGEKFSAGKGQLVPRTTMILDESSMKEGKLLDTGVRNLRFLSRIIVAQKLSFEFPYHEFEIDTDISVLVLGETKTILPVTIAFPHVKGTSCAKSTLSLSDLNILRKYFATIGNLNISIPESIAEEMQNYFVRQRKESLEGQTEINEEWFGTRILVAKALARVDGREMVSREDWDGSLEMCSQWEQRRK